MSVITVKSKLLEALNAMQTLKAAYDWETSNSNGYYPYATLTLRNGVGEFRSTAHNMRTRGFTIRVYQEQSKEGQGPEMAEEIAMNVINELEQHLDMNTTLSGACKYAMPIGWRAEYVDRELDTRVLEIEVDAVEIVASR